MNGSQQSSSSVSTLSVVSRDVLWESVLRSLRVPLAQSLRDAGLDDPTVLNDYPRSTMEDLKGLLGISIGGDGSGVPSGAASSGTSSITYGHLLPHRSLEWFGLSAGGVPETDHASLVTMKGGDPKTDHASLTTDRSGDQRTDHSLCTNARVGGYSPQLGWLATQTATPDSLDCTDLAISRAGYPEHADGFTTFNFHEFRRFQEWCTPRSRTRTKNL